MAASLRKLFSTTTSVPALFSSDPQSKLSPNTSKKPEGSIVSGGYMPTSAMSGDGNIKHAGLRQRLSGEYLVKSVAPGVAQSLVASPKPAPLKNQKGESVNYMANSMTLNQGPK